MAKETTGRALPRPLAKKLKVLGEQFKNARLRRGMTMEQLAEKALVSRIVVSNIEKGSRSTAIGYYMKVLLALELENDILLVAKDEEMARLTPDVNLKIRVRRNVRKK